MVAPMRTVGRKRPVAIQWWTVLVVTPSAAATSGGDSSTGSLEWAASMP